MFIAIKQGAKLPNRATKYSAGYDLYALEDAVIPAHGFELVKTGISVKCPKDTYGRIAPRSGLALRYGLGINAGVIDPDYEGEIGVILTNISDKNYEVGANEKIAQLIFTRFEIIPEEIPSLHDATFNRKIRKDNGFGSSGY